MHHQWPPSLRPPRVYCCRVYVIDACSTSHVIPSIYIELGRGLSTDCTAWTRTQHSFEYQCLICGTHRGTRLEVFWVCGFCSCVWACFVVGRVPVVCRCRPLCECVPAHSTREGRGGDAEWKSACITVSTIIGAHTHTDYSTCFHGCLVNSIVQPARLTDTPRLPARIHRSKDLACS